MKHVRCTFRPVALLSAVCLGIAACFSQEAFSDEVLWKMQAERLQKISASIFDSYPFAEPPRAHAAITVNLDASILPKINGTVGGKEENLSTPPVHGLAQLAYSHQLAKLGEWDSYGHVFGGYTPKQAGNLAGIDPDLTQWLAGFRLTGLSAKDIYQPFISVGLQVGEALVEGPVTAPESDDRLSVETTIGFIASGAQFSETGLWFNVLLARKRTRSTFHVEADDTTVTFTDVLNESAWPLATQFTIGWKIPQSDLGIAVAELWIPERLLMPRVSLSYTEELCGCLGNIKGAMCR